VPTGGIGSEDAKAYLDQPNVAAVGGTWLVPQDLIDARDWGHRAAGPQNPA